MTPTKFKAYRKSHRVALLDLAKKSGISIEKITQYELGQIDLPHETLETLTKLIADLSRM